MTDCVVIGGGVAGLATAVALADRGHTVTLCEARPQAGGRASSFAIPGAGHRQVNGQHLLAGCYDHTRALLERLGTHALLTPVAPLRIPFLRGGRCEWLAASKLPHPAGLVAGLFRYGFISRRDGLRALRFLVSVRVGAARTQTDSGLSVASLLRRHGQSAVAREALWRPIVLATMNAEPELADAGMFRRVLRELFLRGADASALLIPTAPLAALFAEPALRALRERGAYLRLHTPVRAIDCEDGAVRAVHLPDGLRIDCRCVVSTVPPWSLAPLLRASGLQRTVAIDGSAFMPSPIVSVLVRLAADPGLGPMTGLLDSTVQWVFAAGRDESGAHVLSCTISAADLLDALDRPALEALVRDDLLRAFPHIRQRDVISLLVLRERRATWRPLPGIDALRPGARTAVRGLLLAGDWTDTGLPATIESAARSGTAAAREAHVLLAASGRAH